MHPENPHTCCFCRKTIFCYAYLKLHIEKFHTKTKRFNCDLCLKFYHTRVDIARHMQESHGKKKFSCHICDYKTSVMSHLNAHKKTHYTDKVACPVCNKQVRSLVGHMTMHKSRKKCPICQKMIGKYRIRAHAKTHSRNRRRKCGDCGEELENAEELRMCVIDES